MAAKKVQGYLDYHRIGPLFEDLMAKLIKDMPDQPIPFLIRTLKKLHPEETTHSIPHSRPPSGSKARSPMSSSIGLTGKTMTRHSFDDSSSRRSALAKSWAAPDSFSADGHHGRPVSASKATREYDRPWLTGIKKGKARDDHAHPNKENTRQGFKTQKTSEKVPWNSKTKVPSHDFDELFALQSKSAKGEQTKAKEYHGAQSWDDSEDLDSSLDKRGIGYPLHIKRRTLVSPEVNTDDGLEGEEFRLPRDAKTSGDSSEGNSVMSSSSLRSNKNKAKIAAEEHRKHLQSLLQNTSRTCLSEHHDKLAEDDDMDEATEILESSNDLESEGVANPSTKGARLTKSSRSGSSSQEPVKVSICARCARIIAGLPSDQRSDAGSISFNSADEDFESVSQAGSVTDGPRRITWPSGFDSESEATVKKGMPMWQSSSSPQPDKGKHMYRNSTFLTDLTSSPGRPPSASTDDVSDDGLFSKPVSRWQYGGYSTDNETETNYHRSSSPDLSTGRPWTRPPPDSSSEAGSVDWVQERNKNRSGFQSRGFRRSEMTDDSDQ